MTTTDLIALARELNSMGWTYRAAHEPGDYDRCDECREACDELAAFIAPLIAREKAEAAADLDHERARTTRYVSAFRGMSRQYLAMQAERDALARQVEAVRDIHTTFYEALSGQIICAECDEPMPCRTVRALDGDV